MAGEMARQDQIDKPMSQKDVIVKWFSHLPPLIQPAAAKLWGCRRHLANFESPSVLVANLGVWIRDYGLKPEDANRILVEMLAPGQMSNHRFASDLMADLDARVAAAIKKAREERHLREIAAEDASRSAKK